MFRCRNSASGMWKQYKQHHCLCQQSVWSVKSAHNWMLHSTRMSAGRRQTPATEAATTKGWRESVLPRVPRSSAVWFTLWQTAQVICCLPTTSICQAKFKSRLLEVLAQTWPVSFYVSLVLYVCTDNDWINCIKLTPQLQWFCSDCECAVSTVVLSYMSV